MGAVNGQIFVLAMAFMIDVVFSKWEMK